MTLPVFLADTAVLAAAAPGAVVLLDGAEGRHAVSVLRMRAGEGVDLVDGAGRRVRGTVADIAGRDELHVRIDEVRDEPPSPVRLVLVQALGKGGRDEQAVEAAVEVGVDLVVPWRAARCVSVWEGPKIAKGRARWSAVALAAAKQARRAYVPEVAEMLSTKGLVAHVRGAVAAGSAVLLLHEEATTPLGEAALPPVAGIGVTGGVRGAGWTREAGGVRGAGGDRDAAEAANVADAAHAQPPGVEIIVGPEGGIGDDEVAALTAAGAQLVRLGPHVLRTSTAGPVAIAVLAQRLGYWG